VGKRRDGILCNRIIKVSHSIVNVKIRGNKSGPRDSLVRKQALEEKCSVSLYRL